MAIKDLNKIVVIGCGGIGSQLSVVLMRYLNSVKDLGQIKKIVLVDGDKLERKNLSRQEFKEKHIADNKAQALSEFYSDKYKELDISFIDKYIDNININGIITDNSVVFLGVDNNKTRNLVNTYCLGLKNVLLLSGGNDLTDGNIQVVLKVDGMLKTKSMEENHKDILEPTDKLPSEMSCQELFDNGTPQVIFANVFASTLMLNAFWQVLNNGIIDYSEVWFDIKSNRARPVNLENKAIEI